MTLRAFIETNAASIITFSNTSPVRGGYYGNPQTVKEIAINIPTASPRLTPLTPHAHAHFNSSLSAAAASSSPFKPLFSLYAIHTIRKQCNPRSKKRKEKTQKTITAGGKRVQSRSVNTFPFKGTNEGYSSETNSSSLKRAKQSKTKTKTGTRENVKKSRKRKRLQKKED